MNFLVVSPIGWGSDFPSAMVRTQLFSDIWTGIDEVLKYMAGKKG